MLKAHFQRVEPLFVRLGLFVVGRLGELAARDAADARADHPRFGLVQRASGLRFCPRHAARGVFHAEVLARMKSVTRGTSRVLTIRQ